MKVYNRIDLKAIILWITVLALTFFVSVGSTYAFFTASSDTVQANNSTAIVAINYTNTTINPTTTLGATLSYDAVTPGSIIEANAQVNNVGTVAVYVLLKFEITIDSTVVDTSYYTVETSPTKITIPTGDDAYTDDATALAANASVSLTVTYTISDELDNDYCGKAIQARLYAVAVQQHGFDTAVEATEYLVSLE